MNDADHGCFQGSSLLGSIRNENQRILHIFLKKGTLIEVHQHTASKENGE